MGNLPLANLITAEMKAAQRNADMVRDYSLAVQKMLDGRAAERHYDSIQSAITYRDDPNPVFAAEGAALFAWRSGVWSYSGKALASMTSGKRKVPDVDAFLIEIASKCPFEWPSK